MGTGGTRLSGRDTGRDWRVTEGQCGNLRQEKLPGIHEADAKGGFLVMEDMEPEPANFCNKVRLPVVALGHQTSHKTFGLHSILPARCAGAMEVQNLWKGPTNDWSHAMRGSPCMT